MAVSSITIVQGNIIDSCNLLAIHNPLVFLIDVAYTLEVPENLYCDIQDVDENVLGTFTAIPYSDDEITGIRTYAFIADKVLRAYMNSFNDFKTNELELDYVEGITKQFTIRFYIDTTSTSTSFTAIHAARQFGETSYLSDIYNNVSETYYTGVGMPVYIYIYNADINNDVTIGAPASDDLAALDYDSTVFVDSDLSSFKIL